MKMYMVYGHTGNDPVCILGVFDNPLQAEICESWNVKGQTYDDVEIITLTLNEETRIGLA